MKKTGAFTAEIKQLMDLVIHSLYSHPEIFLRELISNASDALDKRRFLGLTHAEVLPQNNEELRIQLVPDKSLNTLKIVDNGIGMNSEDVVQFLGTIAQSGTKKFQEISKAKAEGASANAVSELIGQFGVGFYSAFMVAQKVVVHTQKVGLDEKGQAWPAVLWESTGDGTYILDECVRPEGVGTTITLYLKDSPSKAQESHDEAEESERDFSAEWEIRALVKKYSDFIAYPVVLNTKKKKSELPGATEEDKKSDELVSHEEVINSQKALWLRPPADIKPEEYNEFYKHLTHDWNNPIRTIHYKAEGKFEFTALLYFPEKKPWDFYQKDNEFGLNLYAKKVFIKADAKELVPTYLRFVKGLVDSPDFSLNVSREMLQQDRQLSQIRKNVVSKILNNLKDWLQKDRENYEKFFDEFGATLKEGLPGDFDNREKLQDLILFKSSHSSGYTTLEEYISRMPAAQKDIYFMSASSIKQIVDSPYMEKLKEKGFEVIYMTDAVDEWVTQSLTTYKEKKLQSITREDLNLSSEEEKKQIEEEMKTLNEKYKPLTESMKTFLESSVKSVKLSDRLKETAAVLVHAAQDPSARMESILKQMGRSEMDGGGKRILEINPLHPVIEKMLSLDAEKQKTWSEILYNQALLNEGSQLPDPHKFTKQITELMKN